MRRKNVEWLRMTAAAFVAVVCVVPATADLTMYVATATMAANDAAMGEVVDADAEHNARHARTLARHWSRAAIAPTGPQVPGVQSQRMPLRWRSR